MGKPATVASSALIMMGGVETADAQYWRGHGWSYHGGYYRHGGWRGPRRGSGFSHRGPGALSNGLHLGDNPRDLEMRMTNADRADAALHLLVEGNARFQRGEARFTGMRPDVLAKLAKGQQPCDNPWLF